MLRPPFRVVILLVTLLCAGAPARVLAWGSTGHRIVGRLAMDSLPAGVPDFLRTPASAEAIGELAREPDRWKGAGRTHDSDRDPGHFLDLGDDGKVFGGPELSALPDTRAAYEAALRAAGSDSWKAGYLPYSIIDGWQQLAKDFALWRMDVAGAAHTTNTAHRSWLVADRAAREALILRDIGTLAHYVGDGSQPLHMTVHFNGWGPYPNPEGYTLEHIHGPFEGEFVRDFVDPAAVRADMAPYRDCACPIGKWTVDYLAATSHEVIPLYRLYAAGGFTNGDARGRAFVARQLALGADGLRDLIVDAWRASASGRGGWPEISVADVEAGRIDPYDSLFGAD